MDYEDINFFKYHPILSMCIGGILFSFLFVYGRSYFLNKQHMPMEMVSFEDVEKFMNFDFSERFGDEFVVTETSDGKDKVYKIENIKTGRTIVIVEKDYEK